MKGKEAFQTNAQEWKNLSEQEKNKYQLEAAQVCTCYNSGLICRDCMVVWNSFECSWLWVGAKDNKMGIFCFFAKHSTLRSKSKDWLTRNRDKVSRVERHVYQWIVSELAL